MINLNITYLFSNNKYLIELTNGFKLQSYL